MNVSLFRWLVIFLLAGVGTGITYFMTGEFLYGAACYCLILLFGLSIFTLPVASEYVDTEDHHG